RSRGGEREREGRAEDGRWPSRRGEGGDPAGGEGRGLTCVGLDEVGELGGREERAGPWPSATGEQRGGRDQDRRGGDRGGMDTNGTHRDPAVDTEEVFAEARAPEDRYAEAREPRRERE